MTNVFVWTLSDVVSLAVLALCIIVLACTVIYNEITHWWRRRK